MCMIRGHSLTTNMDVGLMFCPFNQFERIKVVMLKNAGGAIADAYSAVVTQHGFNLHAGIIGSNRVLRTGFGAYMATCQLVPRIETTVQVSLYPFGLKKTGDIF